MGFRELWDVIGARNGGIDWREGQGTGSYMLRQMILTAGRDMGLVCRRQTRGGIGGIGGICIPPGSPLRLNDLRGEPSGF